MKSFLQNLLSVAFILLALAVSAQTTGRIGGKVVDKKTGEELIGVAILVEGTSFGAITDFEGKYVISNLKPGTYNLLVNYVSYNKKMISGVEVKANDITSVSVSLEESTNDLKEVVVSAEVKRETASGLLIQQKNAATISDGISAEAIRKTPDRNTSDVLKRVSGASIQDNKFAIIRGLNERYTTAYINGSPLPSSESDRKAFSFDIFPATLLDNIVILKTATPDMPGEFGGGIIEINTKSVPDNNFQSLSVTGGYNSITTFKDQVTYQGGKTDWLGFDDGTRALPSEIPNDKDFPTSIKKQVELAKYMKNDWALQQQKFLPNFGFQYTFGHVWGKKESKFGTVFALTYNRNNNYSTTTRKQYDSLPHMLLEDYEDQNFVTQTLSGALANFSYKINANNQITFKNLYSINAEDKVISRTGTPTPLDANPILVKSTAQWFTSNKIYSAQLGGNHYINSAKLKLNWVGGYSQVQRDIPDLRRNVYTRSKYISNNEKDTLYQAVFSGTNVGPDYSGNRFYATTNEKIYSIKADVSRSFDYKEWHLKNSVKLGGLYQERNRDFSARQLGYIKGAVSGGSTIFPSDILYLPQDQIFSEQNMGQLSDTTTGFGLANKHKPTDTYSAKSKLTAGFIMFDNRFKERYRLIWGVRVEHFQQYFSTVLDNKKPYDTVTTKVDFLPSVNLVVAVTENQNIRFSYSQTVNRPEFRELAPFAFYDYSTRFVVSGNDSLTRCLINNFDLRYEWYPRRGQLASASVFYKDFSNPIEQVMRNDVSGEISYKNAQTAKAYGLELEFRVLLGSLLKSKEKSILNDITVFSNLTLIKSTVEIKDRDAAKGSVKSRPLQGQSPYIINSGVQYANYDKGWTISASYNKVGQRIAIVGTENEPDIWENGRDVIDLQVGKTFFKNKLDVRFNLRDLLAQKQTFFLDRNHNQKLDNGTDDLVWVTTYGRTISMNISYKF